MTNTTNIHWYDLDGTLWQTDAMLWIIDKNNPDKCIIKINQYVGSLITSGFYINDNLYFKYNGQECWLSKELFDKINTKKQYKLEDLGISWREYTDYEMIQKQASNLTFHSNHIDHLKNTKDTINLITTRGNKEAHIILLNKLNNQLKPLNIYISNEYFINDPKSVDISGNNNMKKCFIILQNMIGYKINIDKFVPISLKKYNKSYFYDDEQINIDTCLHINTYISLLLSKTMLKLREIIIKDIQERSPVLYTNLVTSNKLNPFITKEIKIVGH